MKTFEIIIIGGSFSGLSAAMVLGRSLRKVLIIDEAKPCNIHTPFSHNLLTQDGKTPSEILNIAREQVKLYKNIHFYNGRVINVVKFDNHFEVHTNMGISYSCNNIILATGLKDVLPKTNGFRECWGKSIIHCPYCHGYEVRNEKTGIISNGEKAFHFAQLIFNWSKKLTLFTNGPSTLTHEQLNLLKSHKITIIEDQIIGFEHKNGQLKNVILPDSIIKLTTIYTRPEFKQTNDIAYSLGCEFTEEGLIKTDIFQRTTIKNVFACGDNSSPLRSLSQSIATGNLAGTILNNQLIQESF